LPTQMTEEDLAPSSDIVTYEDAALPGLRIELLTLERNIQDLDNTKAEYLSMIHAFNEECDRRLGELIKKLVKLREERLFMFKPKLPDSSNDDTYEKSKNASESFRKQHKEIFREPIAELSAKDRAEIRKNYRQAGRLCHPDTVGDGKKKKAEEVFKTLSTAYAKGDKEAVKKILKALQSGECLASNFEVINDKALLKKKIENSKAKKKRLENELKNIKTDKIFQLLSHIDDWDEYFEHKKEALESQIHLLLIRSAIGDPERISFY
ncbi:MAG: DnaJ domain-containing protein, partial [Desulfobulbus sp.]